ncbi:MAG: glycosyltransferase family 39 protein [Candidatus Krumholzibacteriota bacterium]|nr:glycosyltransferase family 39 protein [Candidatus Krumholzibacteriota bacterium]
MLQGKKDNSRLFISESFLASLVIFIALAMRISHVIFTTKLNPLAGNLVLDAAIYDRWAKALVWGGDPGSTQFMQAPFFPWFVSLIYRIFGPDLTAVRTVHALLGTLTCGFIMASTRRLFRSSTAGILAGTISALYLPAIFYEGVLAPATLILFLNSLFLFLMIPDSRYPTGPRLLLAGFILGLSVITKPVALLLLPFAIVHLLLRIRKFEGGVLANRKREWAAALRTLSVNSVILVFGLVIAMAPLTIRNARLTGEFIPLTTGGGINFYIGNNPESTGFYSVPTYRGRSLGGTPEEQNRKMHDIASSETGRELTHSEVSDFWMREGIESSLENTGKWADLLRMKSIFFWNKYERANIESLDFHRRFGGILILPLFNFGIVAPLALTGIFISRGRWRRLMLLYGGVMTYFAAGVIFYILARYRLPVLVFLIPFAGAGAAGILKLFAGKQWIHATLMVAAFLLIAKLVNTTVAEDTPLGESQNLVRLGSIYSAQGDRVRARASFEEAIKIYPQNRQAGKGLELLGFPAEKK